MGLLDFVEVIQQGFIDEVGTGSDDDADNIGNFYCLLINGFQVGERFVGVGIGLKVGEVPGGPTIAALMEFDAFFNLLPDAFLRAAVGRIEGIVAAKGAASGTECPIAVRTAEAGIDADFLHSSAELLGEVVAVAVEASSVEDGLSHGAKIQKNLGLLRDYRFAGLLRDYRFAGLLRDPFPLAAGPLRWWEARWAPPSQSFCTSQPVRKQAFVLARKYKSQPANAGWLPTNAERKGFEPLERIAFNGFRDRPDRPLRHLS